jgi:1-acyl-sn-glycerol-3-phosphate acyltransferase
VPRTEDGKSPAEAPLETVLVETARLFLRELGASPRVEALLSPEADLVRDLGLGSLERVELALRVEAATGRRLSDQAVRSPTLREMAASLEPVPSGAPRDGQAAAAPAVQPTRPAGGARSVRVASSFRSLAEALVARADEEPDRPHAFFREGETESPPFTRGELADSALSLARALRRRGAGPGETVALMLPTGPEFLGSFCGVLLSGAAPVPLYPPLRGDRIEAFAGRAAGILRDAGCRLLLVPDEGETTTLLRAHLPPELVLAAPSRLRTEEDPGPSEPLVSPRSSDPALVQYTSGSTGRPKGVLLDHAALLANIRAIGEGVAVRADDAVVSWLPLYHDMGLVGSWLFALVQGIPITLLPPASFLVRPERWLRAIHERRGTLSAAPNFAYELCARRVPEAAIDDLDLSSWREALDGSEPVFPETLDAFARRFARAGFRRESLRPVYGLAESAVALSFPPAGRGPLTRAFDREILEAQGIARPAGEGGASPPLRLVSVGTALPGHQILVVGDGGNPRPPGEVGRVVFAGPSSMRGYFRNEEATRELSIEIDGRVHFDTGDLGFLAPDGELFLTGRRKDLIIKGGRNLAPTEIEAAADSVEGVRASAAVGLANRSAGTEQLVLAVETRLRDEGKRQALETAVVAAVADAVGLPPDRVVLLLPGQLPRTSSGKLRRSRLRELLEGGEEPGVVSAPGPESRGAAVLPSVPPAFSPVGLIGGAASLLGGWLLSATLDRRDLGELARTISRHRLRAAGVGVVRFGGGDPPSGAILVANHGSYADVPILLALLPAGTLVVGKRELERWPLVGTFVRRGGHPLVDREDFGRSLAAGEKIRERILEGRSVLFFPEATFTSAAGLRPFKLGPFEAAVATGRPLVPIGIRGARRVLRGDSRIPRPGRVEVRIGEPMGFEREGWRAVVALRDRAREAIAELSGEPPLDLVAAGRIDR